MSSHRDITDIRLPRSHVRNPCYWPNIPRARKRMRLGAALTILGLIALGWWLPIWFLGALP